MREIKFRTWTGEMEYDITVGKFGTFYVNPGEKGDGLDINDTSSLTPFTTKLGGCPLMQFTGLLDKNGKEIYEGDIIRYISFDGKDYVSECPGLECFHFYSEFEDLKNIKIIGNIYENPDLLSKQ